MNPVKNFIKIIDSQTIIVTLLALIATYVCNLYNFSASLPSGLIGVAIIFPIVFSINSAYKRREEALRYFASIKAHALAFYYAHRDWASDNPEMERSAKLKLSALLTTIMEYFSSGDKESFRSVYKVFSQLSLSNEAMRKAKVANGEISRVNQYLRSIIIEFEKMRNIMLYRTPISLRAYSQIFLNIFPILYAPYFAEICKQALPVVGYSLAALYSIVLVSLDNIQEDLENPYDSIGDDDINLDVVEEYSLLMEKP